MFSGEKELLSGRGGESSAKAGRAHRVCEASERESPKVNMIWVQEDLKLENRRLEEFNLTEYSLHPLLISNPA